MKSAARRPAVCTHVIQQQVGQRRERQSTVTRIGCDLTSLSPELVSGFHVRQNISHKRHLVLRGQLAFSTAFSHTCLYARTLQPAAEWEVETKSAAFLHAADILAGQVLHKNMLRFKFKL